MQQRRNLITSLLAGAAMVVGGATAPVHADLGDQLAKLLPDDGAAGDAFGRTVALTGAIAVIGAPGQDDNGDNSGSAYLFDITTGEQIAELLPDDAAAGDLFGTAVAISGAVGNEIVIVGAYLDDDNGDNSGSAYIFDITTGQQIAKLLPDDGAAANLFGISVAISGMTAIVGAPHDNDNGNVLGSAYLFDVTTGKQIARLLPAAGDSEEFGYSVAIDGNVAIVGAPFEVVNGHTSAGAAYLFDATTGRQIVKLLPDDGAAYDGFGVSVAISGHVAIVGTIWDDDNGDDSGAAYVFDITTGQQIAKLLPDDGAAFNEFGWGVAMSGAIALIGSRYDDNNGTESGSAYLFDISNPADPVQIAKLLPDDGAAEDQFGLDTTISGTTAIVGAYLHNDNGDDSGAAYIFDAGVIAAKCPWDLDDSGIVGSGDLITLLGAWGKNPGHPADFDGDGNVGTSDLIILLGNWGPCGR